MEDKGMGYDESPKLYAIRLAENLHKEHWPENTGWKPLPDLLGVLTQIDNMCTLMRDQKQLIAELEAENTRLCANIERLTANPADYRYWEGRYRDAAAELEASLTWQPISTAPKDGTIAVLVWTGYSAYVAHWLNDDRWIPDGMHSIVPTHWMKLPEPPKG